MYQVSETAELKNSQKMLWEYEEGWDNGKWCFMDEMGEA